MTARQPTREPRVTAAVLIVAAGRGQRAAGAGGTGSLPKQYVRLGDRAVLAHTIAAFATHPAIARLQVVIHPDDAALYADAIGVAPASLRPPVHGGATRQESVRLGLEALRVAAPGIVQPEVVLIHDAARPFVGQAVIDRVLAAVGQRPGQHAGAIAAVPVSDSLKRAGSGHSVAGTVERAGLWRAQTPQGFLFEPILAAHRKAYADDRNDFTDDAALAEWAGLAVGLVEGAERNVKLTTSEDLRMAEQMMSAQYGAREVRMGQGFDVHRFADGDGVWLCGIKLPHTARLDGHSDADVALHALTDALLGAIGDGDIGIHFPPSDPKWKGAASRLFLAHAAGLVAKRGGQITNVDITILAEAPKIAPHRVALRQSVADILGIAVERVSVKATTTEGLGFTGRREGMAAMAVATVTVPATG